MTALTALLLLSVGSCADTTAVPDPAEFMTGLSPVEYDIARLGVGDEYYVDRTYTITSLSSGLADRLWIKTANDDKGSTADSAIAFTLLDEAVVVIGYERNAASIPNWLGAWEEVPSSVSVVVPAPISPLRLFHKTFAPGPVVLGGNLATGAQGASSMYVVLLLPTAELASVALQITPTSVSLNPGATAQFSATVTDPLGRPGTGGTIQWTATGGTITTQGLYTAGDTPGSFQVTGTEAGSGMSTGAGVSIRDPGGDTTPPVLSNGQPTGTLAAGTTQTTMSATTNEAATCKWGISASTSYTNLPYTFTTTSGTLHTTTLTGLTDGQSYTRYVRCQDGAGNANPSSYVISFSVRNAGGSGQVSGVTFHWSTHRREASGSDNWPITWSDDGHQYTSWGDGNGFSQSSRVSLGFARVEGDYNTYAGYDVWGGAGAENPAQFEGKSYGMISVGGVLYAWVSPGSGGTSMTQCTLYKSTNKGATWSSTGVQFTLATHSLIMPTILNFGQDNAGARDGYVYHYTAKANNSNLQVQKPGEIHLMRVPVGSIDQQSAYEFYTSTDPANPTWGTFADKQPVFTDPDGVGWSTGSVIHVPGLNRYVLTTEHTSSSAGNIAMHEAPEPWGPWTQILRETGWGPIQATTFYWNFAPKWFRNGGVDFTLVFTGVSDNDSWNTVDGSFTVSGNP
jgi:hypothetical protein